MPAVAAPQLSVLDPCVLPDGGELDELVRSEALVEHHERDAVSTRRLDIEESELRGLAVTTGVATSLRLRDTRLEQCDLSNVNAQRGVLRRVEFADCRLVGFAVTEGELDDVRFVGGTMMLSNLTHSTPRRVAFENVNLRDASFIETQLESVTFEGCQMDGADFRNARLRDCSIRGTSLDGIVGVESLRGLTMPWTDLVGSAAALATALGIAAESDDAS